MYLPTSRARRFVFELADYLNVAAIRCTSYSVRHFRLLGLVSGLVPAVYAIDYFVGEPHFDTLLIRTLAFVASIPLIVHSTTLAQKLPNVQIYFVCLVTYVLPFTYGLMLILNAGSAPVDRPIQIHWILQYLISLFLFIQLIPNGLLATFLWIVSTVAAGCSLFFLDYINWEEIRRVMLYPAAGYLTAIFIGIFTNRNVAYVNAEKLRAASAIGGNIAHELRTPLASIRSLARSLSRISETMVEAYESAKSSGLPVGELNGRQVEGFKSALATIESEVAYSNTVIDMLLLNTSDRSVNGPHAEVVNLAPIVHEAVDRYPFNNSYERSLVSITVEEDFSVFAPRLLLVHVIFNLLKNGIYHAQKKPTGRVSIVIRCNQGSGIIEVTDTGAGMSAITRRQVFDRFFTTAGVGQGTGVGLSFCKMVMESVGGSIHCESKEGRYTTFRLTFPEYSQNLQPETV